MISIKLAVPDPQRDLLVWMHDAPTFRAAHSTADWTAFRNLVKAGYGVDPEDDGTGEAAARSSRVTASGHISGNASAKRRSATAVSAACFVSRCLGRACWLRSRAPATENDEDDERRLRDALVAIVPSMSHAEACARVLELEAEHGARRSWVWRYLGESPYAEALQPLARLADSARGNGLPGANVEEIAAAYSDSGWRCDEAAMSALSSANGIGQLELIASVVRALYLVWLDRTARQFQGGSQCRRRSTADQCNVARRTRDLRDLRRWAAFRSRRAPAGDA